MRDPAAAAKLLAELRGADAIKALDDLTGWLRELDQTPAADDAAHAGILALIQETGIPHASAALAPFLLRPADRPKGHDAAWPSLTSYLAASSRALCDSALRLSKAATSDPSTQNEAAAGAARALNECRRLAKTSLVRHLAVPADVWREAYAVHRGAEAAQCSTLAVRMHGEDRTTTTVEQELLRLLMLAVSSPEMMTPGQIEVADWAGEHVGGEFTLRPPGVADNPFCFDPAGDAPPHRAPASQERDSGGELRYFGPGIGYEALGRIYKQMGTSSSVDIKASGKAIAPHVQLSAVQHLLVFWGEKPAYTPPGRTPAASTVQVVRGYSQTWQQLSRAKTGLGELTLAADGDVPLQPPESWALHDTGGNELGVQVAQASADVVHCGDVVAVSGAAKGEWWLALVRALHAEAGHVMHASLFILSRDPQAVQIRMVIPKGEESGITEQAARQFSYAGVHAIIVSDGSGKSQANLLLPPEIWKEGRAFELATPAGPRYLRCGRMLRHGDDYVRATFDWMQPA
ncbi:MAG TPA: hypothetical protein VLY46_06605 [Usitatibacter sp.]|nr:hypothetical protein [Usitatibacter sp.]